MNGFPKRSAFPKPAELHIDDLAALEALLDERNVTRAAARLGIIQSALCARLARPRKAFDDHLFVPASSGRGMVPTARALGLQEDLAETLGRLRSMLRGADGFDPGTSRRAFVIAMPEQPTAVLAPQLVHQARMQAPNVRLFLLHPPADAVERLEDGTLDVLVSSDVRGSGTLMARALLEAGLLTA